MSIHPRDLPEHELKRMADKGRSMFAAERMKHEGKPDKGERIAEQGKRVKGKKMEMAKRLPVKHEGKDMKSYRSASPRPGYKHVTLHMREPK